MRYLLSFLALAGLSLAMNAVAQQTPRPNVLFIFIDDLRPELGCYGNSVVKTPNIDGIASRGLLFKNHYVQVPTCGASRFSLLTGLLPTSKAHLRNDAIERFISPREEGDVPETFIHHLRRNGYRTVGIGKVSHSADGLLYAYTGDPSGARRELPYSWDELVFNSGKWKTGWNAFFGYADGSNRQSRDGKVKPYEEANVDDDGYVDGLTAELAVAKIHELSARSSPFFLGVGFFKPHLPFTAPARYWELYDENEIPLAAYRDLPVDVDQASLHNSGEFNSYQAGEEKPSLDSRVSDEYARKLVHAYYASISYIDAQVGKLVQALREAGVDKNTIVIIWGDHGWHLGDHRVWGKHTLSEKSLRSPLIIAVPGMKDPGRTEDQIVSTIDIYPSLMRLCQVPFTHKTDGHSFAALFSGTARFEHPAYSYFNNGISVRTERYRLARYFREALPNIELYDHKRDPEEHFNVQGRKKEIAERLMKLLGEGNTGLFERN